MAQKNREAQVGLTVILSVIILIAGMLWFKQFRFSGDIQQFSADFAAVDGLQERDRVQVRGIRMGAVDEFRIIEDFVRVDFHVDQTAELREDASIRLSTIGIVGEMVVEIDPGAGTEVAEGHIFKGELAPSMGSMTGAASDALKDLRELSQQMQGLVQEIQSEGQITGTLGAARQAAGNLDDMVRENRAGLRAVVENFRVSSAALRDLLTSPDSSLAHTLSGASRTAARADTVLDHLEQASASLAKLVARLEKGEGSAGMLLNDEGLYVRAESTLTAVEEFLDDLRRNPKRFFRFSVIDF